MLRDQRRRRGEVEPKERAHVLGRFSHVLAVKAQNVLGFIDRVEYRPSQNGAYRVQPKFEGGDDAEVTPSSAQGPEEVLVLFGTCRKKASVGGYHIGRNEVVAREAVPASQMADAPA
jgi:hypothetical protein